MRVTVNGKSRDVPEGASIADLVDALALNSANVVAERNGEPVERERFADVTLVAGDVVEIVRPVQGG